MPSIEPEGPDAPPRRKIGVRAARARVVLPWGVDLGHALVELRAGADAVARAGGWPFLPKRTPIPEPGSDPKHSERRASPVTELTIKIIGSLSMEAHDHPLARCLRGKAASLGPALAAQRASDAANPRAPTEERAAAYDARVREYARATRRAALGSFPDRARETGAAAAAMHAAAIRASTGDARFTVVMGGGGGGGGAAVSAAERAATRADAPWSDDVRLKVARAARVDVCVESVSVDLPLAPGALFKADSVSVSGVVVAARQAIASETDPARAPDPTVPIRVGARRFTGARSPRALPRPPLKTYTDIDVVATGVGGCYATASEPAACAASRELTRVFPPPSAAGRGGRAAYHAAAAARAAAAAAAGWPLDPETGLPACAPSLPWWDRLRSTWRGRARFVLYTGPHTTPSAW